MGNTLGAPRASSRVRHISHTGSEFSEKVVRTTLTNKTVLFSKNNESIEARFGPALAHKFSQKAA